MSNPASNFPIETPRLILRPFELADLEDVVRLQGDPVVMEHYASGPPLNPGEAARVLHYHIRCRAHPVWVWAITLRPGGKGKVLAASRVIGQLTATFTEWQGEEWVELAWMFGQEHWGQDFTAEALVAALEHGRETLDWKRALVALPPDNRRAAGTVENLGFQFVAEETTAHGSTRRYFTLRL